jgi:ATP-dependent exoDNAse (exonuclease V) beta subunit
MKILEPNVMVLASAGSGKTYQLSNRIIGFIAMGVDPATMVALTFTRKAAGEFTDAILSKLAEASLDLEKAERLRGDLAESGKHLGDVDFLLILESLIKALPRMTLGTMDGFFTKVVKAFPLELGISAASFQLVEGTEADIMRENLLQGLLQEELSEEEAGHFFQAFRKSLMGQECITVRSRIDDYTKAWHRHWMGGGDRLQWGPEQLADGGSIEAWMSARLEYAERIQGAVDSLVTSDKRQPAAWQKMAGLFADHTTGSGVLGKGGRMLEQLMQRVADGSEGDQTISLYKNFTVPADAFETIREALQLAAKAEMASACASTRAVAEVIGMFDQVCERRLRRKGKFGFDDVKAKMGEWTLQEDKRLMREALDYRLDAKYQHWLLDEFQDTSRVDWRGLSPLIDEAAVNEDGSVFLVGDKKQAIYAWRGGDVRLFDELRAHYGDHLAITTMKESYRSASEVLELVNCICGNRSTMEALYGAAAARWEWEDHIAAKKNLRGHARVECIVENEEKDARLQRLVAILREVGISQKKLSCGVLVRTNAELLRVADFLRQEGFAVIEEGQRAPAKDNPIGVTLLQLLRWLADPADSFAEEVVRMSPCWNILTTRFGEYVWSGCQQVMAEQGVATLAKILLDEAWSELSTFGRHRSDDLLQALRGVDQSGTGSAKAAAQVLEKLLVVQSPGAAEVQVLTIHKSKGLGFDVVVLPLIARESIPDAGKFDIARGDDWICKTPPQWARLLLPPMREAEKIWGEQQQYEAMCVLYVALTRAKQGLYVLLEEKELKEDNNSLAQWIVASCPATGEVIFEAGSMECFDGIEDLAPDPLPDRPRLGAAVLRRKAKTASKAAAQGASAAMQYGTAMHALMETIAWLDETPFSGEGEMAERLAAVLQRQEWRDCLEKRQRVVELQREIPVEGHVDGTWVRGIIDRLHIFRDEQRAISRAEIIDYKTDRTDDPKDLHDRHVEQLHIYRILLARALAITPEQIDCLLLGFHAGLVVKCGMPQNGRK